jgi:hypothetical protein
MMQVADLDEVQYELELDGQLVRRQIGRRVWEEKGWATVAIAYQERSSDGAWKPARVALLRFRREHEMWRRQAAIALPAKQALGLAGVIHTWGNELMGGMPGMGGPPSHGAPAGAPPASAKPDDELDDDDDETDG